MVEEERRMREIEVEGGGEEEEGMFRVEGGMESKIEGGRRQMEEESRMREVEYGGRRRVE